MYVLSLINYSGQQCYGRVNFDRSKKVSFILINNIDSILAHKSFIGAIDTERFNNFMYENAYQFGKFPDEPNCILMLDGLPVHHNPAFKQWTSVKELFYWNLAAYRPNTNLTEPLIGIIKRKLKCSARPGPTNTGELIYAIGKGVREINDAQLDWYRYLNRQGYGRLLARLVLNN